MKNLRIILLHEMSQQVRSFKFLLTIILAVVITFACTYVQVKDFGDRYNNYVEARNTAGELKNTFRVYSEFRIPALIPPNPLSIFSRGYDEQAGNKIVFSILDLPGLQTIEQKSNPFLSIFSNFDIVSIVGIILSVMAIFMTADAISGEREGETLKLVLSHRVGRSEYFLAKYLGSVITMTIPLLLIFLVTLIYMHFKPEIEMSPADWARVMEVFISCMLFLSAFILIGLLISSLLSTAAVSILVGLIVWLLMVIVYPGTVDYMVAQLVDIPTTQELEASLQEVRKERDGIFMENTEKCGFPEGLSCCSCWIGGDSYSRRLFITEKAYYLAAERQVQLNLPVLFEYQDRELDVKDDYSNTLYRQKKIAGYFKFLLPNALLERAANRASGTDYRTRVTGIHEDARLFRTIALDYLRDKGAIGLKFFTQMPREEFRDRFEDYDEETERMYCDDHPLLNVEDAPVFTPARRFNVPFETGMLAALNLVLIIAGAWLFAYSSIIKK